LLVTALITVNAHPLNVLDRSARLRGLQVAG
jgi:hypothetical protein